MLKNILLNLLSVKRQLVSSAAILLLVGAHPGEAGQGRYDILQGNVEGTYTGLITTEGFPIPFSNLLLILSDGNRTKGFDRVSVDYSPLQIPGLGLIEFDLVYECLSAFEKEDGTKISVQRWYTTNSSDPISFPDGTRGISQTNDNDALGIPDTDYVRLDLFAPIPPPPEGSAPCSEVDAAANLDPNDPLVDIIIVTKGGYKVHVGRDD